MTDLTKVAERLRAVGVAYEVDIDAYFKAVEEIYGKSDHSGTLLTDQSKAINGWLAERDPTPLTVEALVKFGAETLDDDRYWLSAFTLEDMDGDIYLIGQPWPLRTVGDLRTLARLAAVKLKETATSPGA